MYKFQKILVRKNLRQHQPKRDTSIPFNTTTQLNLICHCLIYAKTKIRIVCSSHTFIIKTVLQVPLDDSLISTVAKVIIALN